MKIEDISHIEFPAISVIVLTFNHEKTISKTLDYILNQNCNFQYEVIIGDDFSTDETKKICLDYQKKFPSIIKLIFHEQNLGVTTNWINCIWEVKSKYFASCGDDYWHNQKKLQLQYDYMELHPVCGVLHTDYDEININKNKTTKNKRSKSKDIILEGYVQHYIFNGTLKVCAPTMCIRKNFFDKYIPVQKFIDLNFPIEDWPTLVILSKYSTINYLPISTVTYRIAHESLSNLKSYEKVIAKFKREKIMYKFICNLFPNDFHFNDMEYDSYINQVLLSLSFRKLDYKSARKFGIKSRNYGQNNLKIRWTNNRFSFYLFCLLKKLKNAF